MHELIKEKRVKKEVKVGSRIFNIVKITDIISSSFLYRGGGGSSYER